MIAYAGKVGFMPSELTDILPPDIEAVIDSRPIVALYQAMTYNRLMKGKPKKGKSK